MWKRRANRLPLRKPDGGADMNTAPKLRWRKCHYTCASKELAQNPSGGRMGEISSPYCNATYIIQEKLLIRLELKRKRGNRNFEIPHNLETSDPNKQKLAEVPTRPMVTCKNPDYDPRKPTYRPPIITRMKLKERLQKLTHARASPTKRENPQRTSATRRTDASETETEPFEAKESDAANGPPPITKEKRRQGKRHHMTRNAAQGTEADDEDQRATRRRRIAPVENHARRPEPNRTATTHP